MGRDENIKNYIKDTSPDVLLLQEIKTQNENFPSDEFENLGYSSYIFGQKSYNGVAIISKYKLENVETGFIKDDLKQSRIITGELSINLKKKIEDIKRKINNGLPTIPTTLKDEIECNIFLRANDLESFSKLRDLKDNF